MAAGHVLNFTPVIIKKKKKKELKSLESLLASWYSDVSDVL